MNSIGSTPGRALAAVMSVTCLAAVLLTGCAQPLRPGVPSASGVVRGNEDAGVRSPDDLYRHVNGAWLKSATFPPEKAYIGAADEIYDATQAQLRQIIESAQRSPGSPEAKKVGDLFASFMDEAAIEGLGIRPLAADLAAIDAVSDRRQLAALFARLERLGVDTPFGTFVTQDARQSTRYVPVLAQSGLGLPDRDYYLQLDDPKFKNIRTQYVVYLGKLLQLARLADAATAEPLARAVLDLETKLAAAQRSRVESRDPIKSYNLFKVTDLSKLGAAIDWPTYLSRSDLVGRSDDIVVREPGYLQAVSALLESVPLDTWKTYERVQLLAAFAPYLGKDFIDARFAFVGVALAGTTEIRPRWKRGVVLVDDTLGEALGKVYVERYFPPSSKARMDELVANLLAAYRQSIGSLDWMSPATRQEALVKLAKFNAKIGYPKRWIDYSALEVRRDDLIGNVIRARAFEAARQIAKLGHPIDRDEWGMTPQTINAYYDPSLNEIVFPAAFLQGTQFNPAADDAVNYGAIGMVIGHEISHGFDDSGSQYDGDGNLRNWWTDDDRQRFAEKTKALVAQYSAFVAVPPDYHVNGDLTLGENIADNSGLAIAYKAYHLSLKGKSAPAIDGMSGDERFFFGFAQAWRSKVREEALLSQIKADPHSPDEFRVNGTVRNHPAFYSTFGVKPGDRMYLAPADRVSIW